MKTRFEWSWTDKPLTDDSSMTRTRAASLLRAWRDSGIVARIAPRTYRIATRDCVATMRIHSDKR